MSSICEDDVTHDEMSDDEPSDTGPRVVTFKASYWNYEETDDHQLLIHIGGRTSNDESVHAVVKNFHPSAYLELPERIKWNRAKCVAVFDYFKNTMKADPPLGFELLKKFKLHNKKLCNTMKFTFATHKSAQTLGSKCRNGRGVYINGIGHFKADELKVHENNVDPIIKFTVEKKISLAGWITMLETIDPSEASMTADDRKFTVADIDLYADAKNVVAWTPEELIVVKHKYFSFDIECYSKNHNSRLPDPEIPENEIFQIANTCGRFGDKVRSHTLFSRGNPHDIKNVNVVRCKNEKELLLKWRQSIIDEKPDIFLGYNILKFDWNYIIKRAELLGIYTKFAIFSRIIGQRADIRKMAWSSSACGEQEFRYLDAKGIIQVDVILEIERNYRLPKYTLDAVSEYFLKEHKDDITPRQLFMLYDLTFVVGPHVEELPDGLVPKEKRIEVKKLIQKTLQMRRCHGVVKQLRTDLMNAKKGTEFKSLVRDAMTLTGTYNVQDTVLPVKLSEKLNLITTMEEMSNCMGVPMSYLHTRGQQVKVLAQIYRETQLSNIIIPYRGKDKDAETQKYQGAIVVDAKPGDHENVVCFDFGSLYPSVMIAWNICYTTLKEDNDPIPDELCNVIEFRDHVGCEHDPQHRKKKAEDILCKDHRYRFLKVITHPDGTRENEGLMPKLERTLLGTRKGVKKEMEKLQAKEKMVLGLAEPADIEYYKKMGYEIVEKGSLTPKQLEILQVGITVLNAKQNALKISANSVKADTPIPCMLDGTFVYTTIDRLGKAGTWKDDGKGGQIAEPIDNLLVWSDIGFTPVNYVFRHARGEQDVKRVFTHVSCVDVTEDHSLLNEDGFEVAIDELDIGDTLMHKQIPLPDDTPSVPLYDTLSNETIGNYSLGNVVYSNSGVTISEKLAFVWGLFFAEGTAGVYGSLQTAKSTWVIYNQDKALLKKARDILRIEENGPFEISNYYESARCYHLTPKSTIVSGAVKKIAERYRDLFYDERCRKRVPDVILTAPLSIRQAFFYGYYAGDGSHFLKKGVRVSNKGGLGTAQLCYLAKSLGYQVSVNHSHDDIYRLQCSTKLHRAVPHAIKKIEDSTVLEETRTTFQKVVRNDATLALVDGVCVYKGIEIHCERMPRQKLLDSLDLAQKKIINRGVIVGYSTKKKAITYECHTCEERFSVSLCLAHKGLPPRHDKICGCESKYEEKEYVEVEDDKTEYVYDIETESHHFAAGIGDMIVHNSMYGIMGAQNGFAPLVEGASSVTAMGRMLITEAIRYILETYSGSTDPNLDGFGRGILVYGDTDSSMVTFKCLDTFESFAMGDKVSRAVSHHLKSHLLKVKDDYEIYCPSTKTKYTLDKYPRDKIQEIETDADKILVYEYDANPIILQFENLYKRYLLLSKKRYIAYAVNRKGEVISKIKKGMVMARRDNSLYLRNVCAHMTDGILDYKSEEEVMGILYDHVHRLFTRQIPDANLIIYTGVKSVIGYAKKKEKKQGRTVIDRVFIDADGAPIDDPIGPLDPRLVYPNLPQALLALKMLRRGDDVPANTRLEYLYLEVKGATHQGEKAEDYTFYRENKDIYGFRPDRLHYIEKQLAKPVSELINVKYPRPRVPYEKIDDALVRCINDLEEMLRHRVLSVKVYSKIAEQLDDRYYVGWFVKCKECRGTRPKFCKKHNPSSEPKVYCYKKFAAQVQYILDSAARKKANPAAKQEIDETRYPELLRVCRLWKARHIVDALHAKYGIRKRTVKRPSQTGEKLRIKVADEAIQVLTTKKIGSHPKGTLVTLRGIRDELVSGSVRPKSKYLYTIEMPDGKIVENVERSAITTWFYKDGTIMKDILLARGSYKVVVEELNQIFSPIVYLDGGNDIKMFEVDDNYEDEE